MKTIKTPLKHRLVYDLPSTPESGRNSEGSFLRAPDGAILFAYSHYNTDFSHDDSPCDIAMIRSEDEGEHWSEPVTIARAADFAPRHLAVANIHDRVLIVQRQIMHHKLHVFPKMSL